MRKVLFTLGLAFMATMLQAADFRWAMITQKGQTLFMNNVGYILNSDGSSSFTIVMNDNSTIDDVTKVSFAKVDASGVKAIEYDSDGVYAKEVEGSLIISGCNAGNKAEVFSANGKVVRSKTFGGDSCDIDVSTLPKGAYVLRIGNTAIKFLKK